MATLSFRIAGGGGFTAPVHTVREVLPHKRPNKARIRVAWGDQHSRSAVDGINEFVAVGDWKKIKARWTALLNAGGR